MIRAVLFDLDNTLIDRDAAFRQCVHAEFRDSLVRDALGCIDRNGQGDRKTLLHAWQRHGGKPLTLTELGSRIAARLTPDSELLASLDSLRLRFKVGMITNGSSRSQREKMHAAGLSPIFPEACWISEEVGLSKPDPAIFRMAADTLGVPPAQCLFVGDYWPHDGAGAVAAGMRARIVGQVLTADRLAVFLENEGLPCEVLS